VGAAAGKEKEHKILPWFKSQIAARLPVFETIIDNREKPSN
jgi:hypothetical protein